MYFLVTDERIPLFLWGLFGKICFKIFIIIFYNNQSLSSITVPRKRVLYFNVFPSQHCNPLSVKYRIFYIKW